YSSRRRHTRSKRDWSSDVCSSDLVSGIRTFTSEISRYKLTEVPVGDTFAMSTKVSLFNEEQDVYQEMFFTTIKLNLVLTNEENVSEDELSDAVHKIINEAIDAKLEELELVVTN